MSVLISDLLVYAQVGETTDEPPESLNTTEIVEMAVQNVEQLLLETNGMVVYDSLPTVTGYRVPLLRLFQNLIGNALKYQTADRKPEIKIAAAKGPAGSWLFSITDNGIGIAPEHHGVIFGAFKRLHGQEFPERALGWQHAAALSNGTEGAFGSRAQGSALALRSSLRCSPGNWEPEARVVRNHARALIVRGRFASYAAMAGSWCKM